MSPGHQRGDQREHPDRAEEQQHERDRQPGLVDVAPEGDVLGRAALGRDGDDEDDRHEPPRRRGRGRCASGSAACAAPSGRRRARRASRRPRRRHGAARASLPGASPLSSSPSVSAKNRSSSVAWPRRELEHQGARLGQRERQLARRPLGVRAEGDPAAPARARRPRSRSARGTPRRRGRRRSCAGGRRVAGRAAQLGERALVGDAAPAHDGHAVAQLLDLREQVARKQHRHAAVGEPADQQRACRACPRGRGRSRARRAAAAAAVRSSAAAIPRR